MANEASSRTTRRDLSLHERFSICRRNCGFPIPDTVLITYPDKESLPSLAFLGSRIEILLTRIPLLGAVICDSLTRKPYFAPAHPAWTAGDILHDEPFRGVGRDTVLRRAITRAETTPQTSPLWEVVRYSPDNEGEAYLAISAQHELIDGMGLLRLVSALTTEDDSSIPTEVFETTVGLSTADYKPSILTLLPIIYREMILPKLPTWLASTIRPLPSWPDTISQHPSTAPWDYSLLSLPPTLFPRLSRIGKRHGVNTLHPILHVAYLHAVRDTFGPSCPGTVFIGSSPRNERDVAQGHSYMAGSYSSSVDWVLPTSMGFWEACTSYSNYLHSSAGLFAGRQAMGMLAYLPDTDPHHPDPNTSKSKRATGWEEYYTTKFERGDNPYAQSLSFSNLGRVTLPPGAVDLVWGFPGSPFAPPLSVALVGHEQGLRVYTTWREGCPVTRNTAKAVEEAFTRILTSILDAESGVY